MPHAFLLQVLLSPAVPPFGALKPSDTTSGSQCYLREALVLRLNQMALAAARRISYLHLMHHFVDTVDAVARFVVDVHRTPNVVAPAALYNTACEDHARMVDQSSWSQNSRKFQRENRLNS